jgi:hypothetical protein
LGRSQAVRQRILIPPFGGSIPPAPATGIIKPPQSSSHLLPSHRAHDDKTLLIRDFSPQAGVLRPHLSSPASGRLELKTESN